MAGSKAQKTLNEKGERDIGEGGKAEKVWRMRGKKRGERGDEDQ